MEQDWSKLATVGPPEKWLQVWEHYQELLTQEDASDWWREQFEIANAERNELKEKLKNLEK